MSLEQALALNTAALEANTAAILGKGGSTAKTESTGKAEKGETATSKTTGKTTTKKKASEHTREDMQALLTELKEKKDTAAARTIINDVAGVKKMDEIPDDKIDAVVAAAKEALAEEDDSDDDGDGI